MPVAGWEGQAKVMEGWEGYIPSSVAKLPRTILQIVADFAPRELTMSEELWRVRDYVDRVFDFEPSKMDADKLILRGGTQ
eukprot:8111159-Karenia_brevis.AAC.1